MQLRSRFGYTLLLVAGSALSSCAQTMAPAIERLQFSAVQVTADEFQPMCRIALQALGLKQIVKQPNLAAFASSNGSIFEIYGPGAPEAEWQHGQAGVVTGFLTPDIRATAKAIQDAGGLLVGDLHIAPRFGIDGSDYAFRLYRAPDGRLYALAQNKGFHP